MQARLYLRQAPQRASSCQQPVPGWVLLRSSQPASYSTWRQVRPLDGIAARITEGVRVRGSQDRGRPVRLRHGARADRAVAAERSHRVLRLPVPGEAPGFQDKARAASPPAVCHLERHDAAVLRPGLEAVQGLRRTRHQGLRSLARRAAVYRGHRAGSRPETGRHDPGPRRQRQRLRAWKGPLGHQGSAGSESPLTRTMGGMI